MKIGYPVINLGLGVSSSHTFRLASLDQQRLFDTAAQNIAAMEQTIDWNTRNGLLFYRISSNLIPFASHSAMIYDWQARFHDDLARIGRLIRQHSMRISMHPGQFVVLNSPSQAVYQNSVRELQYHADVLDLLGLDATHKIQFHLGGLYGDWQASAQVFADRYQQLPEGIRQRLVVENDERMASVEDLMKLHKLCGIPILFDTLHHQVKNQGETILAGLKRAASTWSKQDGVPMVDYSNQSPYRKTGAHADTLDVEKFRAFLKSLKSKDFDIMLEIKNKEASALQAKVVAESLTQI